MADNEEDLLRPDEIDAMLNAAREGGFGAGGAAADDSAGDSTPEAASDDVPELLDPSEIEALLNQRGAGGGASSTPPPPARGPAPTDPAETIAAAERELDQSLQFGRRGPGIPAELGEPQPFQFSSLDRANLDTTASLHLQALQDVELDLRIELGRTQLLIEEVVKLKEGGVVPLDKLAGDPVDILVNGRLIARGEVLVLNDNFCVRVAEILTPAA